ncbi:hypothetical protein [Agrobacterium pusense]|uniref:hypothetical protein n=1 Tax=Agrobacterium pusense TaxID=648995 RepID=UPI0015A5CC4B|nr:hypothetical protein [Agrobacterium pusense]WCK22710.1 hypothetical protein CFBP5496_0008050 [Agrobacterium pusense]
MGSVTRELARRKIDKFLNETRADVEVTTTTFGPLDKYVAANDNVPQANDKLRRLFKGRLTNDEKVELDDALFAAAIKTAIAKERNGDGPKEWVEGHLIPDCSNPASRGVFVPTVPPRTGDFMQVFSGRKYWPMDPRPHEVHIEDIAHSLAMQARYAGHCIKFYSVAEHSVLIARHLAAKHAPEVALAGLLHDAPEAYCVDIPRPLKPYLTNYKAIEQKNWLAIAARYGLPKELPDEVHDADNRIIADELVNLVPMPWHARHNNPLGVRLRYWSPEKAEIEFLATFDALMAGRA